ncbi:hypothetical protein EDD85DRAFT_854074 [Armillaria nabsnona]|nr:hypothetical protein EDD85DRAFT_854074 [Armillaria nabsnona]
MMLLDDEVKDMLGDETSFNEWCEKKKAYLVAIEEHGDMCDAWLARRLEARKGELSKIRRKRLEAVIEKFKTLGWEDLIYRVPWRKIAAHKLVVGIGNSRLNWASERSRSGSEIYQFHGCTYCSSREEDS